MRLLIAAAVLVSLGLPASAEIIRKTSPHSVEKTTNRLEGALESAGAAVAARIDHAAASTGITTLRPTTVLLFGNPSLGTPVMEADQTAALDLPMRVVIFEGEDGVVTLAYHSPAELAETFAVPPDLEALALMEVALDELTDAAIAQ